MTPRERYASNPALKLLNEIAGTLPARSIARDIVVSALLYLDGEVQPGGTVDLWWSHTA